MSTDLTLYGIAAVPTIIALVQAARMAGMSVHLAPIADILLGVAFGVAAQFAPPTTHPVIIQGVVVGIGVGLSAAGLYASVSHFVTNPPAPRAAKRASGAPAPTPLISAEPKQDSAPISPVPISGTANSTT